MSGTISGIKPAPAPAPAASPAATAPAKKVKRVFKPKSWKELWMWYIAAVALGAVLGYFGGMTIPGIGITIPYIGGSMIGAGIGAAFILVVHYADLATAHGP